MFASIALLSAPFSKLDYSIPAWFPENLVQPGLRVAVPLGKSGQLRPGFVLSVSEKSDFEQTCKIKEIFWPLEKEPLLNNDLLELSRNLTIKLALQPGRIFGHCLPAGLRSTMLRLEMSARGEPKSFTLRELAQFSEEQKKYLLQGLLKGECLVASGARDASRDEYWALATDPPWPLRPGAKRQKAILDCLYRDGSRSRKQLDKMLGAPSGEILAGLLRKGLVKKDSATALEDLPPVCAPIPKLNDEQESALRDLSGLLGQEKAACHLLHGVTGSGKTAVYLSLARKCLEMGKSVFLLAPEVALATRLRQIAAATLADKKTILFHGYQNPRSREKTFLELAAMKEPALVVGTRSAIFLPLRAPGLIILDEEHDPSFKQEEVFAYHAREAAWQRAANNRALLLLGSATPDVRTFYAAKTGSISLSRMEKRTAGASLPTVRLVRQDPKAGLDSLSTAGSLLTRECENALEERVKRGEQAIILLNRRGYAPLMFCPSCAKTAHCPSCDVALAWHKSVNRLVCHYCGFTRPYPSPCPTCGRVNLLPLGDGTEKLEERLQTIACQPILRLDRDNARRQGRMEEIMAAFAQGKSPFLVGTQMISKGHHFPNVTLVVVADGDMGLNMPDYRAAERTFQLLVQTAGRAGRGEKPGEVLIQTRNPDHYCWEYIQNSDYAGFYEQEMAKRGKYSYPPFVKLALLRLSSTEKGERLAFSLDNMAKKLKNAAKEARLTLLGPAPAPIAMIRGEKRFHFLIKGNVWDKMRNLYFLALKQPEAKIFKIFLDLDPVNMM